MLMHVQNFACDTQGVIHPDVFVAMPPEFGAELLKRVTRRQVDQQLLSFDSVKVSAIERVPLLTRPPERLLVPPEPLGARAFDWVCERDFDEAVVLDEEVRGGVFTGAGETAETDDVHRSPRSEKSYSFGMSFRC